MYWFRPLCLILAPCDLMSDVTASVLFLHSVVKLVHTLLPLIKKLIDSGFNQSEVKPTDTAMFVSVSLVFKGSDGSDPEEPEHTISLKTVMIFTVTSTDVCTAVCAVHDGNIRAAQHIFSLLVSSFLVSHYM